MVNFHTKRIHDLLKASCFILFIILLNQLLSSQYFRIDLSEDKRFSIKEASIKNLRKLDNTVYIEVFLDGDMPAGFKRLQRSVKETLEIFASYSDDKVQFRFIDPSVAKSKRARNDFYRALTKKGLTPTNVFSTENGKKVEKIIFPGATISYKGKEKTILLLKGNARSSAEERLNQSIEGIEYELSSAISQLTEGKKKHIALLSGHKEALGRNTYKFQQMLDGAFKVSVTNLNEVENLNVYDAVVMLQPKSAFSQSVLFKLDQYLLKGGKGLFLIDKIRMDMDSLQTGHSLAFPYPVNINDLFFKYGLRINDDLVKDLNALPYPIMVGNMGNQPQFKLMPFTYSPLLNKFGKHLITKNLDAIATQFVSSIDTIRTQANTKKTALLYTSTYTKKINAPFDISLNALRRDNNPKEYNQGNLPIAYLLEGELHSAFRNRILDSELQSQNFVSEGNEGKLIVISDANIALNEIDKKNGNLYELGFNPYVKKQFANSDFLQNALYYLTDENGLINTKNKEIQIRPLDKIKIQAERTYWQVLNLLGPLLLILVFGIVKYIVRKKKYASFK